MDVVYPDAIKGKEIELSIGIEWKGFFSPLWERKKVMSLFDSKAMSNNRNGLDCWPKITCIGIAVIEEATRWFPRTLVLRISSNIRLPEK